MKKIFAWCVPLGLTGVFAYALACGAVMAQNVPALLPDPDGHPGDARKAVKVYLLAGQSNMVGMGNLSGAKNAYNGVYFSSDPAVPDGSFQIYKVGNFKAAPLKVTHKDGEAAAQPLAEGFVELPLHGVYRFHGAFEEMRVDGKPASSQGVELQAGKRYPFAILGFEGEPSHFWCEKTDLLGNGDLEAVAKREGKFPWLVDDAGQWTERQDVTFLDARLSKDGTASPLSPTSNNGTTIGPELGFGHVIGEFHEEQVLLIKTAQGNRSLGFDFRPPSSGRNDPDNAFESAEWRLMVEGVRKTLARIDQVVPGYAGQGYELAGFLWFQGHKDSFDEAQIAAYEENLVNLIEDVRKEFAVPTMPVVVATVGFGGDDMQEKFVRILDAQLAVSSQKRYPQYAGNVVSVDTRPFWREVDESPKNEDYHYHRNAETYLRIGDAMGRAMVELLGGKAEPLPQQARPKKRKQTEMTERTEEAQAAEREALRPIILDGIAASYIADSRQRPLLEAEAAATPPKRASQFLRGAMFGLVNAYQAAGIHDYDWKVFGDDLRDREWDSFSFEAQEPLAKENGPRYREVSYPVGMEAWVSPDFDVAKAGWKRSLPPFGQLDGKLEPLRSCDRAGGCGCGEKPRTLWDNEVLLIRGTFTIPPIKDGHRYRIVVGGSNHVNTGEGYAIYLDGKLVAESKLGVAVRQGGQPRGAHLFAEHLEALKDGEVTLAVTSFLQRHKRGNPIPPSGHLTVWIEEQKIPPLDSL